MTSRLCRSIGAWALAGCTAFGAVDLLARTPRDQAPAPRTVRVVLVGDSTVTDDSGWGLGFRGLTADRVVVINAAANGRSSKSFRDEGRWEPALAERGDYYLIQFGHND